MLFIKLLINFFFMKTLFSCFIRDKYKVYKLVSYINCYFLSLYVSYNCILNLFNFSDERYYNTMNSLFQYFIYDTIAMLYFDFKNSLLFYIHHLLFIITYHYFNDYYNIYKYELNNFFLCEISQIFLIHCWLSLTFFRKKYFKINAILLLITYFIFRILNFTYYTYISFVTNLYFSPIFLTIYSMNLYWFYLLLKKAINTF